MKRSDLLTASNFDSLSACPATGGGAQSEAGAVGSARMGNLSAGMPSLTQGPACVTGSARLLSQHSTAVGQQCRAGVVCHLQPMASHLRAGCWLSSDGHRMAESLRAEGWDQLCSFPVISVNTEGRCVLCAHCWVHSKTLKLSQNKP